MMRKLLVLVVAALALSVGASAASSGAAAASLPAVSRPSPTMVEKAGYWRRYCRRYGCPPVGAYEPPPPVVDDPVIGAPVEPLVVVPLRPASCGEFRYWNGEACVDARYNRPYLGPRS